MEITVVCTDNYHREAAWSGVEYAYIVEGEVGVETPDQCPLRKSTETIDGKVFTVLSGTPSEGDIGKSYDVTVGEESWTVNVYKAEASAPTASFSVTVDGYTAKAVFTGLRASFHMFDFDGDGTFESGEEFRYDRPGRYTVVCKAVNNVSEVTSTAYVEVDIVPQEDATLDELTDFHIGVNERMHISISMGCDVGCPFIGRAFDDNWKLEDPTGKTDDDFRGGYTADREEYSRIKEKMIAI